MALMDGVDLAEQLCVSLDLATARTEYDKKSINRSKNTVNRSHMVINIAHSTGWRLWFYKIFLHFINFLMGRWA
jgi:hypothetical protein